MGDGLTYANAINWVYDTLKAAAGTAPLEFVTAAHVYNGDHKKFTDKKEGLPAIIVRAANPAVVEDWGEISNSMIDGVLDIIISFALHAENYEYPYGGTGKEGLFTMGSKIANVINKADPRATLNGLARDAKLSMGIAKSDTELYIGYVTINATIMFAMGER